MRAKFFVIVFNVFVLFMSPISFSNESQSLFDLSLEVLLNVTVSVASPRQENVIETPAIVSKYTRSDMEAMGLTNLKEMFNFIPGVVVQSSLTGFASVQIRGIDEAFNQKVLFLLDGIPYHQPSHSMIPIEGIPWESILHVEVIRGPGAVFHGTQASGGVFNVVTKNSLDVNSAQISLGKNELVEGHLYLNTQLNNGALVSFASEIREEGG
jgi:outer membrane receptor for ferrienterochelin and colicin